MAPALACCGVVERGLRSRAGHHPESDQPPRRQRLALADFQSELRVSSDRQRAPDQAAALAQRDERRRLTDLVRRDSGTQAQPFHIDTALQQHRQQRTQCEGRDRCALRPIWRLGAV
jgi:hypothetical protein